MKTSSPLRYPGGKYRAVKTLLPIFPEHITFLEPFVGGGNVFISNIQQNNSITTINDIDFPLYCFWKECKENVNELYSLVKHHYNKENFRELFYEQKDILLNSKCHTSVAVSFFIVNRLSFSGVVYAGGYSGKRFTENSIEKLLEVSELLQKVSIKNLHFNDLVFDQDFIYLDPPYYSNKKSKLYGVGGYTHTEFDHILLFEKLSSCNSKWMLSYDDSRFIRNLYKQYSIFSYDLSYGMRNLGTNSNIGKELIITNYELPKPNNSR